MERIFELFVMFQGNPLLALLPSGVFLLLWLLTRRRAAIVMSIIWALYALYELGIHARILCAEECDIRVDLLLIAPLLMGGSIVVLLLLAIRALRRPQ